MKLFYSNIKVLVLLLSASSTAVAASELSDIQAQLAKPAVLCGQFTQKKQLQGMKKPLNSSGRFCVVQEKGVLWRTLQPFPDTLKLSRDAITHMQGERVTMRLDAKQEPTVKLINSMLFSLLAGDFSQLEKLFALEAKKTGKTWQVHLTAKQAGLAKVISKIDLEGAEHVQQVMMYEAGGDTTQITFSDVATGNNAMTAAEVALF